MFWMLRMSGSLALAKALSHIEMLGNVILCVRVKFKGRLEDNRLVDVKRSL